MTSTTAPARAAGSISIGDLTVARLGFGTMRLPGPGIWGPPLDHDAAIAVLRRAVELGVDFIDTADSYGPYVAEELIREALHPYPDNVVVATKAGLLRPGPITAPGPWPRCGKPAYLRQEAEMSLRRLGLERLDLFQLHRVDETVPFEDQIGELASLRNEGKIRHVGLSEVSVAQIEAASRIVPIVSVQNRFNLATRSTEDVLDYCTANGLAFIPFTPLATGALAGPGGKLAGLARRHGRTPAQLALAWLLRRSSAVLPIPGNVPCRTPRGEPRRRPGGTDEGGRGGARSTALTEPARVLPPWINGPWQPGHRANGAARRREGAPFR